jgi:hypothetical protein
VDQRGAVDQLDNRAQADGGASAVARVARGEEQQSGAQALPSPFQQIPGDFRHRLDRGAVLQRQFPLDLG